MTNITFEYPVWFAIFCVSAGLLYAGILYYKDNRFHEKGKWLNWALATARFLSVTLIALLLLSPLLKSIKTETRKPVVVLAQDQSESVGNELKGDTTTYQKSFEALRNRLAEKYDVKEYAFGDEVREGVDFKYDDKVSNLSSILNEVYDIYSNQNLGAIVLATDGIYNEGNNPIYSGSKLNVPIYTVALGDTTPKRDVVLRRVFHNKIAYLGDKFGIQVDVTAQNSLGTNTVLSVSKIEKGGRVRKLQDFPIGIKDENFFFTQEIILSAEQSGVQQYRLQVAAIQGEVTTVNNVQDIFVDVLDARQKILLIANAPHPDLAAIRQTVSKNKNYEVKIAFLDNFRENIADFNFAILHQIPSVSKDVTSLLRQLDARKMPRLHIVGNQTNLAVLNKSQSVLTINGNSRNTNEVQTFVADNFNLFTIDDRLKQELKKFPPVIAPFGDFKASIKAQVLLYQKIGTVETEYPLLAFGEENDIKVGVFAAEGIWKWRLFDYLQNQNHDIFDELMSKSIQYLTLKEDKRKFRVSINKNVFNENERIYFDAELYNQSYELINEEDVSLKITNEDSRDFPFTMNKTENAYTLDAGLFPVGNYTFTGGVNSNGKKLTYNGKFSIRPIQLEGFATTANHGLLKLMSQKYDGAMVYQDNLMALADSIEAKNTIKPVIYSANQTRSIINLKWIFFLILFLLSIEWFFRRFFGAY
ncbi:MAG: hypothetical protein ACJAUH_001014 [Saprospiraceae bacterium]|jgi:hypothetical protein